MALHTGKSDERDADYFESTVNRVAPLLSVGRRPSAPLGCHQCARAGRAPAAFDHAGHRVAVVVEQENVAGMDLWEARPLLAPPVHLGACTAEWFPRR